MYRLTDVAGLKIFCCKICAKTVNVTKKIRIFLKESKINRKIKNNIFMVSVFTMAEKVSKAVYGCDVHCVFRYQTRKTKNECCVSINYSKLSS